MTDRLGRGGPGAERPGAPVTPAEIVILAGLVVAAAALRLWRLADLPPGLHVDEAYNLLDAQAVLKGWRPVFLPANAGRDVLYTYLQAPFVGLLGPTAAAGRLASVTAGVAAVPATWLAARVLPSRDPRRLALLSAAMVGVLFWSVHFSRYGIRAVLFAPIAAVAVSAWWLAVRPAGRRLPPAEEGDPTPEQPHAAKPLLRRRRLAALVCGVAVGAAAYAHPAGRGLLLVPLGHAAYLRVRGRSDPWGPALAIATACALIVAAPLLLFWGQHPGLFVGHAQEVSVLDAGPGAVAANLAKVAGMFNLSGDPAPWRNLVRSPATAALPGIGGGLAARPVFDPVSGLFFLAGLALLARWTLLGADWAALLLIWLLVLVSPSVITDAAPNFSRTTGALPVIAIVPALALERLGRWTAARAPASAAAAVLALGIGVPGLLTAHDYFSTYADDPATPMAFDADKVQLARMLTSTTYLSPFAAEHPTVRVEAPTAPRGFDPQRGLVVPPGPASYAYLEWEDDATAALEAWFAPGALRREQIPVAAVVARHPSGPVPTLTVYRLTAPDRLTADLAAAPTNVAFAGAMTLAGVGIPTSVGEGGAVDVVLEWRCGSPVNEAFTTFVHLVAADGTTIAFGDAPPIDGTYPTNRWQVGERILSRHRLEVADDALPGPARLVVGWYRPGDGSRLPLDDDPTSTEATVGSLSVVQ